VSNHVTLIIDTEDDLHRAVELRAAKEGGSIGDVVNGILRQALTAELDEVTGLPPLADVIQAHHDRQLREGSQGPAPPAP
jgi:plasmid stability protein